jgi:rod shape determining protein RodA
MFFFQIFENIGMTMGLMPVTGITLPFISAGGSSVITNMLALGLVLNICIRSKVINF